MCKTVVVVIHSYSIIITSYQQVVSQSHKKKKETIIYYYYHQQIIMMKKKKRTTKQPNVTGGNGFRILYHFGIIIVVRFIRIIGMINTLSHYIIERINLPFSFFFN